MPWPEDAAVGDVLDHLWTTRRDRTKCPSVSSQPTSRLTVGGYASYYSCKSHIWGLRRGAARRKPHTKSGSFSLSDRVPALELRINWIIFEELKPISSHHPLARAVPSIDASDHKRRSPVLA